MCGSILAVAVHWEECCENCAQDGGEVRGGKGAASGQVLLAETFFGIFYKLDKYISLFGQIHNGGKGAASKQVLLAETFLKTFIIWTNTFYQLGKCISLFGQIYKGGKGTPNEQVLLAIFFVENFNIWKYAEVDICTMQCQALNLKEVKGLCVMEGNAKVYMYSWLCTHSMIVKKNNLSEVR